jgi:hypothetical protein
LTLHSTATGFFTFFANTVWHGVILFLNFRFLQGPDTDQNTVQQIRDAISARKDITVQLLNYTKSGRPFWNLFHLQAMRDQNGELQYFIGVQLDGSEYVESETKRLSEKTEKDGSKVVGLHFHPSSYRLL